LEDQLLAETNHLMTKSVAQRTQNRVFLISDQQMQPWNAVQTGVYSVPLASHSLEYSAIGVLAAAVLLLTRSMQELLLTRDTN